MHPANLKETQMRKITACSFLIAIVVNCVVFAQVEDLPVKGVIPL